MRNPAKQARRHRPHAVIRDEIKTVSRAHMARAGAAALSLRAVAAEMGLSSAAIYYYFPNRDALITDLIVDAFRALGAALRAADPGPGGDVIERLRGTLLGYRGWGVAAPAEFELIFGTPIPGYHAPADVTAPEARLALAPLGQLFADAYAQGRLRGGLADRPLPPVVADHMAAWAGAAGQAIPPPVLAATLHAWGLGHGLVALELSGQLRPMVGDAGAFFDQAVEAFLSSLGG
jgi:AcrR family transcriptional regulator